MKDTIAVLIHYTDRYALDRALNSLKQFSARIKFVYVFLENQKIFLAKQYAGDNQIRFITMNDRDLGNMLNDMVDQFKDANFLFLQHTDYISQRSDTDLFHFPQGKKIIGTWQKSQQIRLSQPVLVQSAFLKEQPFIPQYRLPFKEAFFPAWLCKVDPAFISWEKELIKPSRKSHAANIVEKQTFNEKYLQNKSEIGGPSLAIMISNYNMASYLEKAITSCLLQTEQAEQILIIDDGSSDNSMKRLENWHQYKQVTIFSKDNGGKARALNELLQHVKTDFVLELDADDWLDPDAIEIIKKEPIQSCCRHIGALR
ncbi:glycosyltransferase family A protein [Virgibacillus halophilus]|uniref:Glycosyltransferase family A protein n=1 Tax=Tigheibacillus halophilus TaxID=361280 RepID=A0ABU5C1W5_9BACI|nr:glycosyltransferase family A protein [Virgibacillus halophilus]